MKNAHEIKLIFQEFFRPSFTEQSYKVQAEEVLKHLYLYDDEVAPLVTKKQRDYLTTIYLRAYCGCENERFYDELTETWTEIEGHDRGCLISRYPIQEDLSVRTLKRRSYREKMFDDRGWALVEENLYA